jgi:hypothetical protein
MTAPPLANPQAEGFFVSVLRSIAMDLARNPIGLAAATGVEDLACAGGRDLKWRIQACLRQRIPDLQGIHVTVVGNTAAIRGHLRSQCDKRFCLECCRHVPGVMRVVDELLVDESGANSRAR